MLIASIAASLATLLVFRLTSLLPSARRMRALQGTQQSIIDLAVPPDPHRDHIRGPEESLITIVEYADFECPYCGQAESELRTLLSDFGDFATCGDTCRSPTCTRTRSSPPKRAKPPRSNAFWQMHDRLLEHQGELRFNDLLAHARALNLDIDRFAEALDHHAGAARIAEDVDGAGPERVTGTPTFFMTAFPTMERSKSTRWRARCAGERASDHRSWLSTARKNDSRVGHQCGSPRRSRVMTEQTRRSPG